jgi:hypothetical protein
MIIYFYVLNIFNENFNNNIIIKIKLKYVLNNNSL